MDGVESYRAFRERVLQLTADNQCQRQERHLSQFGDMEQSIGRTTIATFRAKIAEQAPYLLIESPEVLPFIRRALGIASPMSLNAPSKWQIAGQFACFLLPEAILFHRARNLLNRASNYEGRKYLFKHFIRRTLSGNQYYDERIDFALQNFTWMRSSLELDDIRGQSTSNLKVSYSLGLDSARKIRHYFPLPTDYPPGSLLLLLVQEGVIQHASELEWTKYKKNYFNEPKPRKEELRLAQETIRCLIAHGIGRQQVASISRYSLGNLSPAQLSENLTLLNTAKCVELTQVFDQIGDLMWRASGSNWQLVLETIGAQTAKQISSLRALLESHRAPPVELTRALFGLGANIDDIATCQQLLLALCRETGNTPLAIDGIKLLTSAPYALSFHQLAQCSTYLIDSKYLSEFLQSLLSHGYGNADSVLAFQRCYPDSSRSSIHRWLTILSDRGRGEPLERVADWVQKAQSGGYFDSFEYLTSTVEMPGLVALQQALKLVSLGEPLLRYVVEDRGLRSFKAIQRWYYDDASGVTGFSSWGQFDAIDKVLLDDAWTRQQFNQIHGNRRCIDEIVNSRGVEVLGDWPFNEDDITKADYTQKMLAVKQESCTKLLTVLPEMLRRTGGVLLPSLFHGVWMGEFNIDAQLAPLTPLLTNLLEGRGPATVHLDPLEVEAIALVYRIQPATVTSYWAKVIGQEHSHELNINTKYSMDWKLARWQLHKPLNRRGIIALEKAGSFSKHFTRCYRGDMSAACQHLSPKQLIKNVKDLETLARHLGSVLAITCEDEIVSKWLEVGFEELSHLDEASLAAYERIQDLVTLFDVVLPDALAARAEHFIQSLSEVDAALWASRLGDIQNAENGTTGRAKLLTNLARVRDDVLPYYLAWARRQRNKFKRMGSASRMPLHLQVVVSKYPAAFFAKHSVSLCTAGNVEMWGENRLAHLLVFDPIGQCLAGMAMLYVELVPVVDRTRHSLLIRALNPMKKMLAEHDVESIVESFFNVAIEIARENGLACVAFPSPRGAHLMSNHEQIETYLTERYIKRSKKIGEYSTVVADVPLSRQRPHCVNAKFYAYENGSEQVDELYVIWNDPSIKQS